VQLVALLPRLYCVVLVELLVPSQPSQPVLLVLGCRLWVLPCRPLLQLDAQQQLAALSLVLRLVDSWQV
jgi:hypothetical protein